MAISAYLRIYVTSAPTVTLQSGRYPDVRSCCQAIEIGGDVVNQGSTVVVCMSALRFLDLGEE